MFQRQEQEEEQQQSFSKDRWLSPFSGVRSTQKRRCKLGRNVSFNENHVLLYHKSHYLTLG